ncbi:MAG: hypothetical protein HY001_04995 [Candidatus Portnoybacteria bacterium]|nr:hypothetical protein [Candidatus Portnoybacteria bacterium]
MKDSSVLLSWQAPEFVKQEKTILWDIGAIGTTILFTLWGIWSKDITLVAVALLAGLLFWHFGKQEPKEIEFAIRQDGIQVGPLLYRYRSLESFWVFHEPPHINELVLRTKKAFIPLVHLNLGSEDPEKVKEALEKFLPEKEEAYPISHILAHIIGY